MAKKILFTTPYRIKGSYDYVGQYNINTVFRFGFKRYISFGLRFIKQNVPDIEILEYPTLEQFKEKLKEGWDVVGFSFFMFETPIVLEMVKIARGSGCNKIWGGNYGTLTPEIQHYFDKIFKGYAEQELGDELGIEVGEIIHPPLVMLVSWVPEINRYTYPVGILFTSRGCPHHCTFCQTPSFVNKKQVPIPLSSIERVVQYYVNNGIKEVFIFDESFGTLRSHSEEVTKMLSRYKIKWSVMIRTDVLNKNLNKWYERGLGGAFLGVESLNQNHLKDIKKRNSADLSFKLVESLRSRLRLTICFYIIGFEDDTVDSIKRDILELEKLRFDFYQVCILTPLPATPLWPEIDNKYGISEKDHSKFDANHLVWNHPNISRKEMQELLIWSLKHIYGRGWFLRMTGRFYASFFSDFGYKNSPRYLYKLFKKGKDLDSLHKKFEAPLDMFQIYHPLKKTSVFQGI